MCGAVLLLLLYIFITWPGKILRYGVGKCIVMNPKFVGYIYGSLVGSRLELCDARVRIRLYISENRVHRCCRFVFMW
jgi:hypothetical protein